MELYSAYPCPNKMSAGAERRFFSTPLKWVDAVSEHSTQNAKQSVELLRQGYALFVDTVRELPGVNEGPSKHWSDYREDEIDYVTHQPGELRSGEEGALRMRISNALGFASYFPLRIGVFKVRDGTGEKGSHEHSANVVVEYPFGEIFRGRVVLHLSYRFSIRAPDWHEREINYDLFGVRDDQLRTIEKADEMDLLLAANAAAALFAEEIRQIQKQPLTPSP
ncbi:MAG: hypothetical protein UX88_C0019G0010 [Candidatus Woesebacteria bacterium GW2011_GWC2_47_16]|uniref:Uncharacterized protein n=1 Tax=Candidatus Woesebacteria bacterium GW2011_GWC2_47_16 TaxID=1618590 RepID=A0A0G1S3D0_9BACT|nr:MAG: hypothetical protein UX88_C0019G0010 [Candidatus Woesebacteria bacterium GW2011_GWC2_47_16]